MPPFDICPACDFDGRTQVALVGELQVLISFPSQNQLGANSRGASGYHYRKLRQEFASALHTQLAAYTIARATLKRRVWLTRYYRPGKRPYDRYNLHGGSKAIVDVLVTRGLLVDDTEQWFEGVCAQKPGPFDSICLRFEDVLSTVTVQGGGHEP
jgi:hypothetical protein